MKLYYPAIFIINEYGYTVEFPDLPGCVTQGDTLEEAFEMAEDAASGWILTSIEDNEEVPPPSPVGSIDNSVGHVNYVQLDIDSYAKKYSSKSVKKTLTIPQWLNTIAENEGLNFSQELQRAIKERLGLVNKTFSIDRQADAIMSSLQDLTEACDEDNRTENLLPQLTLRGTQD